MKKSQIKRRMYIKVTKRIELDRRPKDNYNTNDFIKYNKDYLINYKYYDKINSLTDDDSIQKIEKYNIAIIWRLRLRSLIHNHRLTIMPGIYEVIQLTNDDLVWGKSMITTHNIFHVRNRNNYHEYFFAKYKETKNTDYNMIFNAFNKQSLDEIIDIQNDIQRTIISPLYLTEEELKYYSEKMNGVTYSNESFNNLNLDYIRYLAKLELTTGRIIVDRLLLTNDERYIIEDEKNNIYKTEKICSDIFEICEKSILLTNVLRRKGER